MPSMQNPQSCTPYASHASSIQPIIHVPHHAVFLMSMPYSSFLCPSLHAAALDFPASIVSSVFPGGLSLENMPYTLFCPFAARVIFENCVSGSLFPALRLSRTLGNDPCQPNDPAAMHLAFGAPRHHKAITSHHMHSPLNTHILYPFTSNPHDLFLDLRRR